MSRVKRSGKRDAGASGTAAPADDLGRAVSLAQGGDEDAFRVVYRAVQPGLLRYLRALVGEDAEDVASEAWLQITRDLRSFRGDGEAFRAWSATVARHRAMDHLRARQRRPDTRAPVEHLLAMPAADDTAGAALDTVSTATAIALIAQLPRDQAEAVLLRVVVGLDAEAAAKVLGKRAGAVRTAAHRGLRRLAALLPEQVRRDRAAAGTAGAATVGAATAGAATAGPVGVAGTAGAATVAGPVGAAGAGPLDLRGRRVAGGRVTQIRAAALKDMR